MFRTACRLASLGRSLGCSFGWRRAKVWRRTAVLFLLLWFASWLFLSGLLFVHTTMFSDFCTDDKSKRILQRVCEEYQQGLLTGDLCEDLCVSGQVEYKRCLYYENGKKVMAASWRGTPVVLKSKLENFSSYEVLGLLEYQDIAGDVGAEEELSPLDVVFYATLQIKNLLGLEAGSNLTLPRLWGQKLKEKSQVYSRAELASLWALLQQEEYTFLRVMQDLTDHVAKVLGSCGHFYAVEYLAAGRAWDQNIFSLEELFPSISQSGLKRTVTEMDMVPRVALSFLDMVGRFESDFSHHLHLCDIKPENFAIRKDLTVAAIDVDMAFFEPKMRDILEQNCTNDSDCNFFDCVSQCDTTRKKCGSKRKNSNLQVICEKIFCTWFSPTLLGDKAGHPLQVELQKAVQDCAETEGGEDAELSRTIRLRLQSLLTQLIQENLDNQKQTHSRQHVHTALNF
ncbi:divergent protein kinase domain 1C [Trichomycterus rosablanca]|uniref:divergent protein kinase domain 1C n=1 Tax=Trichomycterus rosablanca TaxID=2290929 RepID=UPI002F35FBF0